MHIPAREREKYLSVAADLWSESESKSVLKVSGISMRPILLDGESIRVDRSVKELKCGDIGVFKSNGLIFVHRVLLRSVEGESHFYRTKGDWMLFLDPPVASGDVAGKVCSFTRNNKQYDLSSMGSKIYSRMMAVYSFGVAVDGKAASLLDSFLNFLFGSRKPRLQGSEENEIRFFRKLILSIDRRLHILFHSIFFHLFHRAQSIDDVL